MWSQSGATHYAAANAFLDGHAAASQAAGLPGTAVQYGPFAGAGMAAAHVEGMAALGLKSLLPSQVWGVWRQAVACGAGCTCHAADRWSPCPLPPQIAESHVAAGVAPQLLYARIDAPRFAKIYSAKGRWSLVDQLLQAPAATQAPAAAVPRAVATAPTPGTSGAAPAPAVSLQQVEQAVRAAAADVLGDEPAGDGSFAAGSFDSLSAVELSSMLSSRLGVQLPGTLVFDYPSVAAMAQHIYGQLAHESGSGAALTEHPLAGLDLAVPGGHTLGGPVLADLVLATRLPAEAVPGGADGIGLVPFARWDLEGPQVRRPMQVGQALHTSVPRCLPDSLPLACPHTLAGQATAARSLCRLPGRR